MRQEDGAFLICLTVQIYRNGFFFLIDKHFNRKKKKTLFFKITLATFFRFSFFASHLLFHQTVFFLVYSFRGVTNFSASIKNTGGWLLLVSVDKLLCQIEQQQQQQIFLPCFLLLHNLRYLI